MKSNKWNLTSAILGILASVLFILAAAFNTLTFAKGLFCVAALCTLISSFGFLYTYVKNRKSEIDKSIDTESLKY